MNSTAVMDSMVAQLDTLGMSQPLYEVAYPPQPAFEPSFELPGTEVTAKDSPQRPDHMSLTRSTLCLACRSLFDGKSQSPIQPAVGGNQVPLEISQRRPGEILHHGLDDLATRASRGCHLCLTVYLSLNPDRLKLFRRMAATSMNPMGLKTNGAPQVNGGSVGGSVGFASMSPIARDQAKLVFRFVRVASAAASSRIASGPTSIKSDSVTTSHRDEADPLGMGFGPGFSGFSRDFRSRNSSSTSLGQMSGNESGTEERRPDSAGSKGSETMTLTAEFIILNPRYAVAPGVRTISPKATTTGSAESFDIAKQWIEDCSFNHMKCSVSDNTNIWKPSHLLDVSIKGPSGAPGVKLVDGMFLDPFSEYVTLSHCWGRSKPVRLHKGTLSALRQGVACSNLPKTFAEAAVAADKLGFRYLWIDALCIMHDNEQAVLKEIGQMHRIYAEASLNLAATSSREDSGGLFYARNVAALQPCVVEVRGHDIDNGVYKILRSTTWHDLVDSSPLTKRAWAFQERALAKRTLHFTRSELMWECQQMCCSEVFPKGLPVTMATAAQQESLRNGVAKGIPMEEAFSKRTHHQRAGNWHQLVSHYSAGKLSYSSDKLLAVSGLARQYLAKNRLREPDYVVGLWKPQLPHALLWRAERGRRPSKYRAPSWSWASIEGRISYPEPSQASKQTCVEIIDLDLKHKSKDVFGMCESARMKVRGFMARGLLKRTEDYWGRVPCTIKFPKTEVEFATSYFDDRLHKLSDDGIMTETLEIYLLPIVDVVDRVEGLLLNATMKKGEFRRIGVFEISMHNPVNWDRFRSVMKGDANMGNYEERLDHTNGYWFASDYTYTITLL